MYERLLTETEKYLEKRKEPGLPVLELWDAMVESSEELKFEMPETIGDFECLIEADKRFIFSTGVSDEEEPKDDLDVGEEEGEYEVGEDFFDVEEMEKIGFNQNQIVSLRKNQKKRPADDEETVSFAPRLGKEKPVLKKQAVSGGKKKPVKIMMKKKPVLKRKK